MDIHQMVNIEIKLITFFVAKDGEAVHSQQKQDLELTVAQILSFSFLLSSSSAKFRMKLKNVGKKPLGQSGTTYIISPMNIQWR